jgi:hypothetical protein
MQGTSLHRLAEAPAEFTSAWIWGNFGPSIISALTEVFADYKIMTDDMDEPMEDLMLAYDDQNTAAAETQCSDPSQNVRNYITNTFNSILYILSHPSPGTQPSVTLRRIVSVKPYCDEDDGAQVKWDVESREVVYRFPGKNKDEAWRFGRSPHIDFWRTCRR